MGGASPVRHASTAIFAFAVSPLESDFGLLADRLLRVLPASTGEFTAAQIKIIQEVIRLEAAAFALVLTAVIVAALRG